VVFGITKRVVMRIYVNYQPNLNEAVLGVRKLGKSINYNYFENPGSFFEKFPYFANFLT
tara:strand:+ start:441 stop:617 length:177 start_codon:yes stop_codon:yes gene_type:complete